MIKILVTDTGLPANALDRLRAAGFDIDHITHHLEENTLMAALRDKQGYLLGGNEIASRHVLEKCPDLKIISFLGVGYEGFMDVAAVNDLKIPVTNTPGTNAVSVAEMAVGLLLNLRRQISFLNQKLKTGHVVEHKTSDSCQRAVGIVGMGNIGMAVAKILFDGFGMKILYHSRSPKPVADQTYNTGNMPLSDVLTQADVVILCLPGTTENQHLIGTTELRLMKKNALLINPAHPSLVDGTALYQAITQGEIAGAAFDAYYGHPKSLHQNDPYGLLSLPDDQFIVTPHTASLTHDAWQRMADMAVGSLINFFATGDDPHIVNRAFI